MLEDESSDSFKNCYEKKSSAKKSERENPGAEFWTYIFMYTRLARRSLCVFCLFSLDLMRMEFFSLSMRKNTQRDALEKHTHTRYEKRGRLFALKLTMRGAAANIIRLSGEILIFSILFSELCSVRNATFLYSFIQIWRQRFLWLSMTGSWYDHHTINFCWHSEV